VKDYDLDDEAGVDEYFEAERDDDEAAGGDEMDDGRLSAPAVEPYHSVKQTNDTAGSLMIMNDVCC